MGDVVPHVLIRRIIVGNQLRPGKIKEETEQHKENFPLIGFEKSFSLHSDPVPF
ncbi:hypothetical protein SDC9_182325 [bioreactor metagenome]|uniref:Uncharacterized protein n=1 Tax=bioreactor metagenome TaxID=1076179 RepID=A0A645H727_9ZZZZ